MTAQIEKVTAIEPAKLCLRRICLALQRYSYRAADEMQLHEGLARVLTEIGVSFEREYVPMAPSPEPPPAPPAEGPGWKQIAMRKPARAPDRFDFLCEGCIVLEAKVAGSLPEATRQIDRYCAHEEVHGVIVVSTRGWAGSQAFIVRDKPVEIVHVMRRCF